MVSQTNEQALENCIEKALVEGARYEKGDPANFDREFAIDPEKFWHFLETTQPEQLAKVQDQANWQRIILERFNRKVKKDGILSVLKKGISINDADLTLLYSLPYNDANPTVSENFERNIFSVTRQVHYSESDPDLSLDMVLFINGIARSHPRAKEHLVRPNRIQSQRAIQKRPRSQRTPTPIWPLPSPLRRRYRRSMDDHQTRQR